MQIIPKVIFLMAPMKQYSISAVNYLRYCFLLSSRENLSSKSYRNPSFFNLLYIMSILSWKDSKMPILSNGAPHRSSKQIFMFILVWISKVRHQFIRHCISSPAFEALHVRQESTLPASQQFHSSLALLS